MSKLEDTAYNYGAEVGTRKPQRIAELVAEIDRLREALEKIVERDAYREIIYPSRRYSEAIYGPCAEIARAALAKEAGK